LALLRAEAFAGALNKAIEDPPMADAQLAAIAVA
jgi:hypothetical protein